MKAIATGYAIVAKTDHYHANRIAMFNGRCEVCVCRGLSLKEAQDELLKMYNRDYEDERPYAPNWGLAVIHSKRHCYGAHPTADDGTRTYIYDCYKYSIVEELELIEEE